MNVFVSFYSKHIIHIHISISKPVKSSNNDNKSSMSQEKGSCIHSTPLSY